MQGKPTVIVNGVEYVEEDAERFADGSMFDATLAHDTEFQGVPCAGNRAVAFYPSGRLKFAWLSRITAIQGVPCAAEMTTFLEGGAPFNAGLAADHEFRGCLVKAGERVTLDENGTLGEYTQNLQTDTMFGGVLCRADCRVWLYPIERPSLVVLAAPAIVGGISYPCGTELTLDPDGAVLDSRPGNIPPGESRRFKWTTQGVYRIPCY